MQGASIANELARWIDLRDNRDRLKEANDNFEDAKRNKHQDYVKPEFKRESILRTRLPRGAPSITVLELVAAYYSLWRPGFVAKMQAMFTYMKLLDGETSLHVALRQFLKLVDLLRCA